MNTIIEKLKAEVERLKEENNNIRCDSNKAYCQGYGDAFVDLLPFLDTLQEQSIEDKEELSDFESALFSAFSDMWQSYMRGEEINVAEHVRRISPQLLIVASRQNKQLACERLKEEIEYYLDHAELKAKCNGISVAQDYFDDLTNAARHFYELGCRRTAEKYDEIEYKRQRADVCEGLEEETEKFIETFGWGKTKHLAEKELISATARHFAQWQKEKDEKELSEKIAAAYQLGLADKEKQLMKEAVEGEVIIAGNDGYSPHADVKLPNTPYFHLGRKVKLIIVKEN